ncbi:restriction endonuclease subunit S [Acinetobacter variabilis]|uniref:restriction endonuclease subunit S n=1 Tax=Acinetobacter variabilis TaxID=70346 RepID=UPI0030F91CB3
MSYPLIELGNLAKFINGDRGKNYPSKDSFVQDGIPFINAGCLSDLWLLDKSNFNYISEESYGRLSSGKIQRNDILFCLRGSLGKFAVVRDDEKGALASSLVILRSNEKIHIEYLKHYLASHLCQTEINNYQNGAAQPNLSASDLKKFLIPLPPLEEQRRIASILDKADAIRQKRQQAIGKLDELLQATFIDMFGDPLDNPKKYQMMTLGSISSFENGDRSNNYPSGADVVQEGIPFLSTKNIKGNIFDSSNMQFITQEKFNKLSRGKVSNGDILITLRGTLGSTCIYEYEYPQAFINAQMMIIRANQNFMSNRFLHIILSSEAMQKYLKSIGNGAAVQQLTATQLKNISIITPDRNNQEIFIKFYESLQNQKSLLKRALNNADDFFKSLQHRAFNETL